MKPASRTVSYSVYAPDYAPGDYCCDARTMKQAQRICRRLGSGAVITRHVSLQNKRRVFSDLNVQEWTYTGAA